MSFEDVKKILKVIFYIVIGLVIVKGARYALPKFYDGTLVTEVTRITERMGAFGILIIILMNILRLLLPIFPSEPFELLAGAMYGPVIGTIVTIIGITIGSVLVYLLTKKLEERFVYSIVGKKYAKKYMKLKHAKHIESITCYILLLPGMPKDLFTYIIGLTNIELKRFIVYVMILRIPSVLMSTIVGANVLEGKWEQGLVIYAVFGGISLVCIIVHRIILGRTQQL